MVSISRFASIAVLSLVASAAPAAAQGDAIRLAPIAQRLGYTYAWLRGEAAVSLSRPGIVVVLHAGDPRYEIGDGVAIADHPPVFDRGDLLVSPSIAATLRRVAAEHPLSPPPASAPVSPAAVSGTLTVSARMAYGTEAVAVRGRAPAAGLPVTITLSGEISRDLPVVTIARQTTLSANDGTYYALIEIATAAGPRDTAIVATVTSIPTVIPASARLVIGPPSPRIESPLDRIPD